MPFTVNTSPTGGAQQKMMNFTPEIWLGRTLKALDDKSIFLKLVNRDYEGQIKGKGDSVRIHHVGNIVAKDYAIPSDRGGALGSRGTIAYQTVTGESMVLSIDKADYFGFEVEDIEKVQADPKYVNELTGRAGFALAQSTDRYVLKKMVEGATSQVDDEFDQQGNGTTTVTLASDKVYEKLVDIGISLDDALCPEDGRYVVVPTVVHANLLKDDRFVGAGADGSGKMRDKGYIGSVAGFEIYTLSRLTFEKYARGYQSTQVLREDTAQPNVPDVYEDATYTGIAGVKDAFSFADQITKTESLRLEGSFADAVRGLHVYGGRVIRPQWLHAIDVVDASAPHDVWS